MKESDFNGFYMPDNKWLLLDTPSVPGLASQLKNRFARTRCYELFADTEMHLIRKQGPLLVYLSPDDHFSLVCERETAAWPGLTIFCSAPKDELLAHLRRMLTVRFSDHYKSLITYYNAQTASYFFDSMGVQELSRWLGPIDSISWVGGTWADKADNYEDRLYLNNPKLDVPPLTAEPQLSVQQENKLQQCLLERHAYFWSRATGNSYRKILRHLKEGLRLGFNDPLILDEWLGLRARFPTASLPSNLADVGQRVRFDNVRNYWEGGRS
jgi:hypothetical protein